MVGEWGRLGRDGPVWAGMGLMMVLFWGGLVWLAFALFRRSPRQAPPAAAPGPEAVVRQQYARGDIDEAQYRRRLLLLDGELGSEPVSFEKPRV